MFTNKIKCTYIAANYLGVYQPTVQVFIWKMNKIKDVEKYIATKIGNIDKYNKKWLIRNEN